MAAVRVALEDQDTGRYVQPNGTMAAAFATLNATLASPGGTSTTWTLGVDLPTKREFAVTAFAVDSAGQQDTSTSGPTARYLVYPGDADPTISDTLVFADRGHGLHRRPDLRERPGRDDTAMGSVVQATPREAHVKVSAPAGDAAPTAGTYTATLTVTDGWAGRPAPPAR